MLRFCSRLLGAVLGNAMLLTGIHAQQAPPPPPVPPEQLAAPEGVEVMARGPVHEAYAEPADVRPQASPLVPKPPPEPIEEMPPDQRPEGDNIQWIPGYWAWDAEQNNYLWVSGFWREPPPGRQWVPGNWQQVEGGWHWVAGFWAPAGMEQLQYVPPPPPSLDQGPSVPAVGVNNNYVPGCWIYRESRYWWRPGFWTPFRPGWVWISAHYIWTPSGYLFVDGYWDHPLEGRGLLFAPVRLANRLLGRRHWFFTPNFVVQPDFLLSALFVRPSAYHYYFGDYFQPRYTRAGFIPWIDYRIGRSAYDPNFAYYRQTFARYGDWERGLRQLYQARFQGDVPRPPHTLVQQQELVQNLATNRTAQTAINPNLNLTHMQNTAVLAPLNQVHNTRVTNLAALGNVRAAEVKAPFIARPVLKLQPVEREHRVQEQKAAAQFHALAQQRRQTEGRLLADGGMPVRVTDSARQAKIELPRTAPRPWTQPEGRPQPATGPRPGARPPQPVRVAPPPPAVPKHEDRPIPRHEPPRPPVPPKRTAQPAPAPRPAPSPPRPQQAAPPPRQPVPPPPPPKKEPPPPKKEPPPPKKERPKKG